MSSLLLSTPQTKQNNNNKKLKFKKKKVTVWEAFFTENKDF